MNRLLDNLWLTLLFHFIPPDDVTGGSVSTCQETIEEYADRSITCTGSALIETESATDDAFRRLNEGICEAVWSGVVPERTGYRAFPQPTVLVPVSLFRPFDMIDAPVPPTDPPTETIPTEAPTRPSGSFHVRGISPMLVLLAIALTLATA